MLAEPQHPRRAVLTLPSRAKGTCPACRQYPADCECDPRPPADAAPLAACATGAPAEDQVPRNASAALARPEATRGHDPRALSRRYWERTLADLGTILGGPVPLVLAARCPLPLRIGVRAEFLAAYPAASPEAMSRWLRRWTSTTQYRRALVAGGMRFDLSGHAVEPISAGASAYAAELLEREVARMAREAAR